MIRRIRIETYLKTHTQQELADLFGMTQSWASQLKDTHSEARLIEVDGSIRSLEYSVAKTKDVI